MFTPKKRCQGMVFILVACLSAGPAIAQKAAQKAAQQAAQQAALQAASQAEELAITLKELELVHQQETGGDELYFSITEYPTKGSPQHYQVPSFPTHWLSKYLKGIKEVVLWQKTLAQCEPINVLISLVEQDFEPWNVDDLLGTVELKVKCDKGKAIKEWVIPNAENTSKIMDEDTAFSFSGDHAEYHAIFKLEDKMVSPVVAKQLQADENKKKIEHKNQIPIRPFLQ